MAAPTNVYVPPRRRLVRPSRSDQLFRLTVWFFAASLLALCVAIGVMLWTRSRDAFGEFGLPFLWGRTWDPVQQVYGALPFIWGTLVSSCLALLVAAPLSLGAALFLAEIAPPWLRDPISFIIELLAAIPSIVYGLWGIFVLIPAIRPVLGWLNEHFGWLPFFAGVPYGIGMMAAGLILAIMILPIMTSLAREVILAVPRSIRDAAYAVGATKWETISGPVLGYGRAGLIGAVLLALGRALGETMAVTMVIGNNPSLSLSLLEPAYSMTSLLANQFGEAAEALHISSLLAIGFLLFLITITVNILARLLLWRVTKGAGEAFRE